VKGVIIQERNAVGITPAVVKASAGAVEHLKIVQVPNLNRALEKLKEEGFWIAGLEALPQAQDLWEASLPFPIALVVGSEGKGLRPSVREKCDLFLKLPMEGKVSSLNAAVAGSIALYWLYRSRPRKEDS
jgi:23S rRNA (guanosine2251-2'-O)-methyltransferase